MIFEVPSSLSHSDVMSYLPRMGWVRFLKAVFLFALAAGRKKKQRHGEAVIPPRSLFDRATPGMLKMRREGKEQKKNILLKQQTQFAKPLPTLVKPAAEAGQDNPEWLISEDWALLQVRWYLCLVLLLYICFSFQGFSALYHFKVISNSKWLVWLFADITQNRLPISCVPLRINSRLNYRTHD